MRNFFMSSAGILAALLTTPAFAADPMIEAPIDAGYNWAGTYIGLQVGYGWANSTTDFEVIDYVVPLDPDGVIGGIYAGYNFQLNNGWVVGAEGDFAFSGIDSAGVDGISGGVPDIFSNYGSDLDWTAALRARVGYGVGRFLPFVAGGVAIAQYELSEELGAGFSVDDTYVGWTIGGGVEFAATESIIVRAEYRYSDYGEGQFDPVGWIPFETDLNVHDVRVGVAYKF